MAPETETAPPLAAPTSEPAAPAAPVTDWRAALPDDLKADKSLEQFKGANWDEVGPTLAKGYVETKKMVGGSLKVPKEDATPEEQAAFYTALGRPETPDKYDIKVPEFPPEIVNPVTGGPITLDQAVFKDFLAKAHGEGLSTKQAQGIMDWYGEYILATADKFTEATAQNRKVAEVALKKEWGAAYPRNVQLARQAVRDLFADDPQLAEAVEDAGNNVALLKGLLRIGERMMEHGEITGEIPPGVSVEALEKDVLKLRDDPEVVAGKPEAIDKYAGAISRLLKAGGKVPTT
jgi:hypothetical protein